MVELQHQCLHHSSFLKAKWHRIVGVPLGMPLLVSYSHYRVRHLQHHRALGTPRDSEFFGFDVRKPLRWGGLLRATFDYLRLGIVLREIARSVSGNWQYDMAQISDRRRREVCMEYRLMGGLIAIAVALSIAGFSSVVLHLWVLPLAVAIPMHFLLELPEHIMCESETTDVLRNTRSITGSWFSTWFTNGNNLHVEHHAAMAVPINRLRARHEEVKKVAKYIQRNYAEFYWLVACEATRNWGRTAEGAPDRTSRANAEIS